MVLRLIRALPGEAAFLAPVVNGKLAANVAPGSRRQDHTTSPYAVGSFAVETAASIASCAQRVVTMAIRPSGGHGTATNIVLIYVKVKSGFGLNEGG
jgi:hypothetical protein